MDPADGADGMAGRGAATTATTAPLGGGGSGGSGSGSGSGSSGGGTEGGEGGSLRADFVRGTSAVVELNASPLAANDARYQATVQDGIDALRRAAAKVAQLRLLSANETAEDIPTSHLKYLLIPAYLADLYARVVTPPEERAGVVRVAEAHLRTFLDALLRYGLLDEVDRSAVQDLEKDVKRDANQQREFKIAKFKRTKEAQTRIRDLVQQLQGRRGSAGKAIRDSRDDKLPLWARPDWADDADEDDELARDYLTALLQVQAHEAMDSLTAHLQELELLAHMAKLREERGDRPVAPAPSSRADDRGAQPAFKPIVIKDTRSILAAQVFRPGWRQPTMTLDEFLELERQRGNVLQGGGPAQEAAMRQTQEDREYRDSEADADADTYKAREKDEFTDVNPRGWGNRYNRS